MDKSPFRKEYRARRAALSKSERADVAKQIAMHLLQSTWYQNADAILCYAASGSEIPLAAIAKAAWQDGKTVCFPRCLDADGQMHFYRVDSFDQLQSGMYGILEPDASCPEWDGSSALTLCLMPGLSFDANGYRLGYGKGYYDRYLSDFPGLKIGICPDCCYAAVQRWEYDRYDIAADVLITESSVIRLK